MADNKPYSARESVIECVETLLADLRFLRSLCERESDQDATGGAFLFDETMIACGIAASRFELILSEHGDRS